MGKFNIGRINEISVSDEPETTTFTSSVLDELPDEVFEEIEQKEAQIIYIDRPVEVIKEVIREVEKPVERVVEKIVEVEKLVEVPIEKPIEVIKEVVKTEIQFIDRIKHNIEFKLPDWAKVVMAFQTAVILVLLLRR